MYVIPDQKTVPPADKMKLQIIETLEILHELYGELEYYKSVQKYERTVVARFFAFVKRLYMQLRPKISEFSGRQSVQDPIKEDYKEFIEFMDYYIEHSNKFTLSLCIEGYKYLTQFCEDYEITRTFYRQVSPSSIDILPKQ